MQLSTILSTVVASPVGSTQAPEFSAAKIPMQMIVLGTIILGAYLGGRLTRKFNLSDVTGQLIGGALMGPFALHHLGVIDILDRRYDDALHAFHFFVFVFLCLIAFGIGEELHISRLKKIGKAAISISLIHSVICFIAVAVPFLYLSDLSTLEILLIASISITSAPAISIVMLNQMRIEGHLRHLTAGVLVLTDLLGVVLFSLLVQLCLKEKAALIDNSGFDGFSVLWPVTKEIGLATLIGIGVYVVLRILVRREASGYKDLSAHANQQSNVKPLLVQIFSAHPSPSVEILLVTIAAVSLGTGIAYLFHLPFLMTALVAGFLVANRHSFAIFDSLKIDNVMPAFNLMFFALVGATMAIQAGNSNVMMLAAIYIIARTFGKLSGTWVACLITGEKKKFRVALPSQLLPQTGVAAVEAVYVAKVLGKPELAGIILPGIVFFGVIGVIKVERALRRYLKIEEEEKEKPIERGTALSEAARKLLAYLSPDSIILDLKGGSKGEVIEEMVDKAISVSPHHVDREQAIQVVMEREKLAPTGMGNGIALPHCRLIGLDEPILIFGHHKDGVVFGGIDEEPCDLILLIVTSGRNPSEHLQIMAATAHLLANPIIRHNLRNSVTPELLILTIVEIAEHTNMVGASTS